MYRRAIAPTHGCSKMVYGVVFPIPLALYMCRY